MSVGNVNDVPQWLVNRLGSSEKMWVDGSIAPYLTKELLKEANDCFLDLPSATKIKLLLSFLHIVRRNLDTLRPELESIIDLAIKDDQDQWVSLTAEFLRYFPARGEFNLNIVHNSTMFSEMRNDIKSHLRKLATTDRGSDLQFVPYEAELLNRKAFNATFGNIAPPQRHFTLKQKPKSATLRAEALAKSSDPAKPRIQPGSSIPVRFKDNSRSLESLSQHITPGAKRAFAAGTFSRVQEAKKQALAAKGRSGVKLLDITEQPLTQEQGSKRRRKLVGVPVNAPGGESSKDDKMDDDNVEIPEQLERVDSYEFGEPDKDGEGIHEDSTAAHMADMPPPLEPYKSVLIPTVPVAPRAPEPSPVVPTPPEPSTSAVSDSPEKTSVQPTISSAPTGATEIVQNQSVALADFKKLKLKKELEAAITETFTNANRVTRPEKILIISFMAGKRENPCPHLGPILTIRLSEHPTKMTMPDGREMEAFVEDYFRMDFSTGEWKRLRKHKPAVNNSITLPTPTTPNPS